MTISLLHSTLHKPKTQPNVKKLICAVDWCNSSMLPYHLAPRLHVVCPSRGGQNVCTQYDCLGVGVLPLFQRVLHMSSRFFRSTLFIIRKIGNELLLSNRPLQLQCARQRTSLAPLATSVLFASGRRQAQETAYGTRMQSRPCELASASCEGEKQVEGDSG